MKNNEFKAHPVYVYKMLERFLFVLIFPVIKGFLQYILYKRISGVILLEGIALGVIIALSVIKVIVFKITVTEKQLFIEDGILFHKSAVIPIKNLSNITFTRHFLLDIIGAVTVSVNTEVGIYGKKDFQFKLYKKDAERLEALIYGKPPQMKFKFPARKIALLSATASSTLTGLIVVVPLINRIGKLLNIGIAEILSDITAFSSKFKTYFPPVVNVVTIVFLLIYGIAFLIALARNFSFSLSSDSEKIEVNSGFYFRKKRIFLKNAVNNVCIDQTPLMHLFRTHTVRVSIGGYGGEKGERSTVVPAMKKTLIKTRFSSHFPIISQKCNFISPIKSRYTKQRFLLLPNLYALIIIGVFSVLMILFPAFFRLFLFMMLFGLVIDGYYAFVSIRVYKSSGISLGKTVAVKCSAIFTVRELYVNKEKIGVISVFRTPADKIAGTCKAKIIVRSESSDSAKARNIPFSPLKTKIFENYGIKI